MLFNPFGAKRPMSANIWMRPNGDRLQRWERGGSAEMFIRLVSADSAAAFGPLFFEFAKIASPPLCSLLFEDRRSVVLRQFAHLLEHHSDALFDNSDLIVKWLYWALLDGEGAERADIGAFLDTLLLVRRLVGTLVEADGEEDRLVEAIQERLGGLGDH